MGAQSLGGIVHTAAATFNCSASSLLEIDQIQKWRLYETRVGRVVRVVRVLAFTTEVGLREWSDRAGALGAGVVKISSILVWPWVCCQTETIYKWSVGRNELLPYCCCCGGP